MAEIDYVLTGDATAGRDAAARVLAARKFNITWTDNWTATATRGSKTKNLLLGGAAQYMEIKVTVSTIDAHHVSVRILGAPAGWQGGLLGASRTKKNFNGLRDELEADFRNAGTLVEMRVIS